MECCVGGGEKQLRGEEEETLRRLIVPCTVEISAVLEHAENPVEGGSDFVSTPT